MMRELTTIGVGILVGSNLVLAVSHHAAPGRLAFSGALIVWSWAQPVKAKPVRTTAVKIREFEDMASAPV